MKIAHVCPFYTPAICGIKQVVEELTTRQVKEGNEVHVYTSDWDKNKRIEQREETINGVHVHRCRHILRIANFATVWPSVYSKLIKEKFDIIHSHLFGHVHFLLSALASTATGAKHIHTTHCPWSDAHRSSTGKIALFLSYGLFSRLAMRFTDKIIAITPWEINFIKKYGGQEGQIVVLPNGMDENFFQKIKNNDFKRKNKIKGQLVLFFGRLNPTKNPDHFVKIAKMVLKQRKQKDVTFVIRGPDEGLKNKVKKLIGKEKRILLLDETRDRKEIIKMYQAADIYVLPSYREGLPLTLFEAMASGLPVVASSVNGVPYEIEDKENGFLLKWSDTKGFVKKIVQLLDDKKLRDRISKHNLKIAKNYDWNKISKKVMELYKR